MYDEQPRTGADELQPTQYVEICVRGVLGPLTLEAFPTLTSQQSGPDTVLRGRMEDPAALYGVLHHLERLGLELLELRRVSEASSKTFQIGDPTT